MLKSPTHYIPATTFKNMPWLVYGWLKDDRFVAIDGRRYPAGIALPIDARDLLPVGESQR